MKKNEDRRKFLKNTLAIGLGGSAFSLLGACADEGAGSEYSGEKVKLLTTDGKIVEVDAKSVEESIQHISPEAARQGIPNRSFVMVIDLAKCKNARKCVESCQRAHDLDVNEEYMKVQLIRDNDEGAPYWFPKPCFHCSEPPCVTVCPTGATFKRSDNIVLIDNDRCIGCKFCITSCPYSARLFNWSHKPQHDRDDVEYSPETSVPRAEGTVMKCDFCPDQIRKGELPHCAKSCPMGVIYFGDKNEDIVTNGEETVRFSQLIKDRAGYRHLEHLGTEPNVYYLPAVNRQFPLERGFDIEEEILDRYKDVPEVKEYLKNENS
jgi:Fe-S-cluster-containing dehydrogenase component